MSNPLSLQLIALAAIAVLLAGCATSDTSPVDRELMRAQLVSVTGSRIQRRVDPNGQARTGAMVQVIDEAQLDAASGVSLADKLGGR